MTKITIPVDEDVASAFAKASPQQRRKIEVLVNLHLRDLTRDGSRLKQAMDDLGRTARERGLTEEVMNELLKDIS